MTVRKKRILDTLHVFGIYGAPAVQSLPTYERAFSSLSDTDLFAALDKYARESSERPTPAAIIKLSVKPSGRGHEHDQFLREVAENDITFGLDKRPPGMTRHEAYLQTIGARKGPMTPPPPPTAEGDQT